MGVDPRYLEAFAAAGMYPVGASPLRPATGTYTDRRQSLKPRGPSESEFTDQVIRLADLRGFLVTHFRPAMLQDGRWVTALSGDRGFPDLVMVRETGTPRLIVAELKCGRNKPTKEQDRWLAAFRRAGVEAYLWRPADWKSIESVLTS